MEETRQPQDHFGITGPDALANTGPQGLPFQSHKTFHSSQDISIQDAPEAMSKCSSHEQVQEQMTCPNEAKGKLSKLRVQYCAGGYGQIWEDEPSFPSINHQPIYSRCQDSGCAGGYGQLFFFS
jgi:hypothetical protein